MPSEVEVKAPFGPPDVQWDKHVGSLPEGAIVCGENNGKPVYAGRVHFHNEILIGTIDAERKRCMFSVDGNVHEASDYEVMNVPVGDPLVWKKNDEIDDIHRKLLVAGIKKNGEITYVGRIAEDGKTYIGWLDLQEKLLHVAKDGSEKLYDEWEIVIHDYIDFLCICPCREDFDEIIEPDPE